jgi:hypothetical protein
VNTLLHAIVYDFLHNLLNVLLQITNKMGLQKRILAQASCGIHGNCYLCITMEMRIILQWNSVAVS